MRIFIFAAGRLKSGPLWDLYREYEKRLSWDLHLKEFSSPTPEALIEFRKSASLQGKRIFLDERGQQFTSPKWAEKIESWALQGHSQLCFFIGGPEGYPPSPLKPEEFRLSLGHATWPHLLVRILLLEQLYRVQQILGGHPYHK